MPGFEDAPPAFTFNVAALIKQRRELKAAVIRECRRIGVVLPPPPDEPVDHALAPDTP